MIGLNSSMIANMLHYRMNSTSLANSYEQPLFALVTDWRPKQGKPYQTEKLYDERHLEWRPHDRPSQVASRIRDRDSSFRSAAIRVRDRPRGGYCFRADSLLLHAQYQLTGRYTEAMGTGRDTVCTACLINILSFRILMSRSRRLT